MLIGSREVFVGFLFVCAIFVMSCMPAQPLPAEEQVEAVVAGDATPVRSSDVVTQTSGMSDTVAAVEVVSKSIEVSAATVSIVTTTGGLTPVLDIKLTAGITGTVESTTTMSSGATDPQLLAAGLAGYRAQYCGVCHTQAVAETRGTFGPPHDNFAATVAVHLSDGSYQGAATTPEEYVLESIVDPQAYIVPGFATTSHRMPIYAHLDEATLDALVAFLLEN